MEIQGFGRLLIIFGLALLAVGAVLIWAPKIPLLGRLPGDLLFRKGGVTIFVPLVTMLLLSLALTALVNLFARLFR